MFLASCCGWRLKLKCPCQVSLISICLLALVMLRKFITKYESLKMKLLWSHTQNTSLETM